jgi:hypothetical protein
LGAGTRAWDRDLEWFFHKFGSALSIDGGLIYHYEADYATAFFKFTVAPMWNLFVAHKKKQVIHEDIAASDWNKAVKEWLERRAK